MSVMTAPSETSSQPEPKRAGLNARHIHFIALGSAIGTGLFYGSAGAIQAAGPSVLLVYLLGGAVVARNREEGGAEVKLTIPLAAIRLAGEGEHA